MTSQTRLLLAIADARAAGFTGLADYFTAELRILLAPLNPPGLASAKLGN